MKSPYSYQYLSFEVGLSSVIAIYIDNSFPKKWKYWCIDFTDGTGIPCMTFWPLTSISFHLTWLSYLFNFQTTRGQSSSFNFSDFKWLSSSTYPTKTTSTTAFSFHNCGRTRSQPTTALPFDQVLNKPEKAIKNCAKK